MLRIWDLVLCGMLLLVSVTEGNAFRYFSKTAVSFSSQGCGSISLCIWHVILKS